MSHFDNRKNLVYSADATTFSAVVTPGVNCWRAAITYKENFKKGTPGLTTADEPSLQEALRKIDESVKFYRRSTSEAAASRESKDAALLESMRVDPRVNDQAYRNACRRLDAAPSARPDHSGTAAAQKITPLYQVITQFEAWKSLHPEFANGLFAEFNISLLSQWMDDNNREFTTVNLDQAYSELLAAGCFRSSDSGRRGGRVVRPYVHAELVAARKAKAAIIEPPANLSPVDDQCWRVIHAKFPKLDPRSQQFKDACSRQIWLWARENAIKEGFIDENQGEMRRRCEVIITGWAQQSNSNLGGNKSTKDSRLWLG